MIPARQRRFAQWRSMDARTVWFRETGERRLEVQLLIETNFCVYYLNRSSAVLITRALLNPAIFTRIHPARAALTRSVERRAQWDGAGLNNTRWLCGPICRPGPVCGRLDVTQRPSFTARRADWSEAQSAVRLEEMAGYAYGPNPPDES